MTKVNADKAIDIETFSIRLMSLRLKSGTHPEAPRVFAERAGHAIMGA